MSQPQEKQQSHNRGDEARCAGLYVLVIRPNLIFLGDFLSDRATPISAVVSAIATAFIAWFTIALASETRRMQQVADQQRTEMELARAAMIEANKISRDSLVASQRAWLRPVVTITEAIYRPDFDFPLSIAFSIAIENVGKSPAISVRLRTDDAFFGAREYADWEIVCAQMELSAKAKQTGRYEIGKCHIPRRHRRKISTHLGFEGPF